MVRKKKFCLMKTVLVSEDVASRPINNAGTRSQDQDTALLAHFDEKCRKHINAVLQQDLN